MGAQVLLGGRSRIQGAFLGFVLSALATVAIGMGCSSSSSPSSGSVPSGTPVIALATVPSGGNLLETTTFTSDFGTPIPAGNVVRLKVMLKQGDGSLVDAPSSASVAWSGDPATVVATDGSGDAGDPIPVPGANPTSFWLKNPTHYTDAELAGVLFITDPGSIAAGAIHVVADVSGGLTDHLTASLAVSAVPAGDVTKGSAVYSTQCAVCHGPTGSGTDAGPGINAAQGNVASDPTWNAGIVGSVVRGDIDNQGVALDPAMPEWLEMSVTSQDFIDAYAWLQTQPQ